MLAMTSGLTADSDKAWEGPIYYKHKGKFVAVSQIFCHSATAICCATRKVLPGRACMQILRMETPTDLFPAWCPCQKRQWADVGSPTLKTELQWYMYYNVLRYCT